MPPFWLFPEILGLRLCRVHFPDFFASLFTGPANRKTWGQLEVERKEAGRRDFFFLFFLFLIVWPQQWQLSPTVVKDPSLWLLLPFPKPQVNRGSSSSWVTAPLSTTSDGFPASSWGPGPSNCTSSFSQVQPYGHNCFLHFLNKSIHRHPILIIHGN